MIYSSRSATAEDLKWRVFVFLAGLIAGVDYTDTADAFYDRLEQASDGILVPDRALARTGQLIYLPNRGAHYESLVKDDAPLLALAPDHPILQLREAKRARWAEAKRAAAEAREAKSKKHAAASAGEEVLVVDAFNDRHSVSGLLAKYGYEQAGGSDDWRSPQQQSGSYATRVYDERWVSLSGSDAEAGLGAPFGSGFRHGDAFDLFVLYEHRGDYNAAVAAYAKQAGLNRRSPPPLFPKVGSATAEASAEPEDSFDIEAAFIRNRAGHPRFCAENAGLILDHHPGWKGDLAYDEFNGQVLVLKPIPGSKAPHSSFRPRELTEKDITDALRWFNRNGFPDATRSTLAEAMIAAAHETIISPVRYYLEGQKWDGKSRLGTWLSRYCGAACTRFIRAAGQAWMIAAVARALDPGCKADCALIWEGPQGGGKSTGLKTLAGPAWFFDGLRDVTSKDASSGLRGKWIIELPELAAMRRSDVEAVKAFLSRCVERYRPPYGRVEVSEPRRCVFAGTTNRSDYLTDDTGSRRFWTVAVGTIDVEALARDRDQLWAEAVHLYRNDEPWWLDGEMEADAAREAGLRTEDDPWSAKVLEWAQTRGVVSTKEILFGALFITDGQMSKADSMRVAGILQRNGWRRDGKFTAGSQRGLARYIPTERGV